MNEPQIKRRRGCLFYGCLTGCILALFILMGVLLGLHHLRKMVNNFTDSQPTVFPATRSSPEQVKELDQRVAAFRAAVEAHQPTAPLALSADDLNALVAAKPEAQALRARFHVAIDADQLKTQVSLPMGQFGVPFFKGRYLNGTATLGLSVRDGKLDVSALAVSAKGNSLPAVYADQLRQNFTTQLNMDTNVAAAFAQIQSIEIKDGKLLIVPKPQPPATDSPSK